MTTKINDDLASHWDLATEYYYHAQLVLDWCVENDVDTGSVAAIPLEAAMQRMPLWNQDPNNYLDMVNALVTYLRVR